MVGIITHGGIEVHSIMTHGGVGILGMMITTMDHGMITDGIAIMDGILLGDMVITVGDGPIILMDGILIRTDGGHPDIMEEYMVIPVRRTIGQMGEFLTEVRQVIVAI